MTTFFVASCGVGGSGGGPGGCGGFFSKGASILESVFDSDWLAAAAFDVDTNASFVTGLFPNSDFDFGTWIFDFFWNGAGGRILELGDSKVAEPFVGNRFVALPEAIPNCDFGRNRD